MMRKEILRDLGGGLILRRSSAADADALAAFNGRIHASARSPGPNAGIMEWTRDLLSGRHPTFHPGDLTIVEDTRTGAIVSSLNLISQRWTYAWYLRVADLPDFLRLIAPVLERRLAESVAVGHSGEVKIGFYRKGVRLRFERGRLTDVEDWPQTSAEVSDARFPDLTFLQLLFGFRSLEELEYAFPDCQAPNNRARVILRAIFPKQPSSVWPVA